MKQPGDILEIIVIGCALRHPEAAERLRTCGVPVEVLFGDTAADAIAIEAMTGERRPLDADEARRAAAWREWAEWNVWERPDWAVRAVDQLVAERAGAMLAPTLTWAGDALRKKWGPIEAVKRRVDEAFAFALGGAA